MSWYRVARTGSVLPFSSVTRHAGFAVTRPAAAKRAILPASERAVPASVGTAQPHARAGGGGPKRRWVLRLAGVFVAHRTADA